METLDFENIGKKIRTIRLSKGFTQDYVASMANVNTSHISNIENNRVKISLTTLVHICNALGITVDYVLADEYTNKKAALDNEILNELTNCDDTKKELILRIIKVL